MNNSTNNKVVPIYSQGDDFKVLHQMLNSPEQIRRRQVRRKDAHRRMFKRKAISLAGAFLAGATFMYLLIHLV